MPSEPAWTNSRYVSSRFSCARAASASMTTTFSIFQRISKYCGVVKRYFDQYGNNRPQTCPEGVGRFFSSASYCAMRSETSAALGENLKEQHGRAAETHQQENPVAEDGPGRDPRDANALGPEEDAWPC